MSDVFLDTSGLIGVVNSDDQWHSAAESVWNEIIASGRGLITTSLILIEVADGLSRIHQRKLAIALRHRLLASDRVEVLRPTDEQEQRAWNLYESRADKEWGMTDCASMIVLNDLGLIDVFTCDHHFDQAGFRALIRQ